MADVEKLDRRITHLVRTRTGRDPNGGPIYVERFVQVWASRHDPRPGNEYEGTTIQSFNSVRYRVRAGSAWVVGDEIRDEDNVRRIVAGIAKSDHRGRYLDLYTTGPS